MAATFHMEEYVVPGTTTTKYLRYIKANYQSINVRWLSKSVRDSSYSTGINAGFYNYKTDGTPQDATQSVGINCGNYTGPGIHLYHNGEQNGAPTAKPSGTIAYFIQQQGNFFGATDKIGVYNGHVYDHTFLRKAQNGNETGSPIAVK